MTKIEIKMIKSKIILNVVTSYDIKWITNKKITRLPFFSSNVLEMSAWVTWVSKCPSALSDQVSERPCVWMP